MDRSRFHIAKAIFNAYRLIWAERVFLLKTAMVPFLVGLITLVFLMQARPDSTIIEDFLWNIPASVLSAWFMFAQARLIFFGEKLKPNDALATGLAFQLRGSIIIWLLFNMYFVAVAAFLFWTNDIVKAGEKSSLTILGFVLIGAGFWGVRFGLAHIVAAIGFDLKEFVYRVNGAMISLRLLGMTLLGTAPIIFIFQILISVILGGATDLSEAQKTLLYLLSAPLSFLISAVLNAAGCFALKEILSDGRRKKAKA